MVILVLKDYNRYEETPLRTQIALLNKYYGN